MKLFRCAKCGHIVYFENSHCHKCKAPLGFDADDMELKALQPESNGLFRAYSDQSDTPSGQWRYCENQQHGVCNWLVPADSDKKMCVACDVNRYIPNLNDPDKLESWQYMEQAKHRLIYSLRKFNLPIFNKNNDPKGGLTFDFIDSSEPMPADAAPTTGHAEGRVTINTDEADPAKREQVRQDMNESYRTLLGHFRHEIGHYYWDVLIANNPEWLAKYRSLFGDERADYGQALKAHYANGPAPDWRDSYVSAYAASHPWEDWAETWAHYLHIVDTLETAYAFGVSIKPVITDGDSGLSMDANRDAYAMEDYDELVEKAVSLT